METTLTQKQEEKRLLDKFAIRAMQSIISGGVTVLGENDLEQAYKAVAKESYNIAEKMIEERRKGNI